MNERPNIVGLFCGLSCALALYVLSVGPALRFSGSNSYDQNDLVRATWRPVLTLDRTEAHRNYRSHLRLWGVQEPACIC